MTMGWMGRTSSRACPSERPTSSPADIPWQAVTGNSQGNLGDDSTGGGAETPDRGVVASAEGKAQEPSGDARLEEVLALPPPPPRLRREWLGLLAALFVSYAYFFQGGGNNQNSRLDLTRAIAERGTLAIDPYHENCADKSFVKGHYYSNKSPGQPILAVPVFLAGRPILRAIGVDPETLGGVTTLTYFGTLLTCALPTALAALALAWVALQLGSSPGGALFSAITFGIGTPIWAYATLFWGHALATACLVFALAAAVALRRPKAPPFALGLAVGAAAGWATVTEYSAAPAAPILAGLAVAAVWRSGPSRRAWAAAGIAVGGGLCLAVILGYQLAAFGSPFVTPMRPYFDAASARAFVIPSLRALSHLLLSSVHGLLPLSPVLALAPVGFLLFPRGHRGVAAAAAGVVVAVLLIIASFRAPGGGWGYGPRYVALAFPFLCLPLALLWTRTHPALRVVLGAAAAYGIAVTFIAVSVDPQPPEFLSPPVSRFLWPAFRDGDVSLNYQSLFEGKIDWPYQFRGGVHPHQAWNLGEKLGLRGHLSLVPLLVVWILASVPALSPAWRTRRTLREPSPG